MKKIISDADKKIFTAESKGIYELFRNQGCAFYIPAYQRPYSWEDKQVSRLFEDIVAGIERLASNNHNMQDSEIVTFIGTIVTVWDQDAKTVHPSYRDDLPEEVNLVIDGQQRMTTIILLSTVIHDRLHEILSMLSKDSILHRRIGKVIHSLESFYTIQQSATEYYPRLIRAYDDCWAEGDRAKYSSPIGKYIYSYRNHRKNEAKNQMRYSAYVHEVEKSDHELIINNLKEIKKLVKDFIASDFKQSRDTLLKRANVPQELLLKEVDDVEYIAINLLILSEYLMDRVCITSVQVANESYAFDVFEALNTTGEPLTSIETLKPMVIESIGLENYESSVGKQAFDIVETYLEKQNKKLKHKLTNEVVLSFACAETGESVSKHISAQRIVFMKSFGEANKHSQEERDNYIKHLSYVAQFYDREWHQNEGAISTLIQSDDEIRLYLTILKDTKHIITIPIIMQFYRQCIEHSYDEASREEFKCAIRSIIAFFVFWRAAHGGTSGIDAVYKDLFKHHYRQASTNNITSDILSRILKNKLHNKILADSPADLKNVWVDMASKIPVISHSKELTRLMLLSAFHNMQKDGSRQLGMIEASNSEYTSLLTCDNWYRFSTKVKPGARWQLEQIAPKKHTDAWDHSLLSDAHLTSQIGNITILPKSVKQSDHSWYEKQQGFRGLCEHDIDNRAEHLVFLEPLTDESITKWDADMIQARSKNLLEHVWKYFAPWLDLDD